ncbi:stigma-specific STIG1-like protein 3 [Arachis stenosperma]|uniref:stigma-specific STIG1-like protein 3 n=1 Tax=Arachis stenosperma TaxID=217475 RepID=UPI0025ABFE64|nr:stigma-specific STIG1-like protein 3 [Arachis stenosperma]
MGFLKAIFAIAITMALSIALITMNGINQLEEVKSSLDQQQQQPLIHDGENEIVLPSKRLNRFLAEYPDDKNPRNPKAADHCKRDNELCYLMGYDRNTTACCNNKCMDLGYDKQNCGACKQKCKKYTDSCCRGECVNTNFDKRHCGGCNNRCEKGQYCVYGLCGYA